MPSLPIPAGKCCSLLAAQLGKLPNRLSVEGHTDAQPYVSNNGYSNWELSADRANAARKLIQQSGVRPNQVADVRGYADQRLRKPDDPFSPSNRRVSIVSQVSDTQRRPASARLQRRASPGTGARTKKALPHRLPLARSRAK